MVQIKLVLDTRRIKSDGTYPIIYRLTNYKKVYTLPSNFSVQEKFWDEQTRQVLKQHPNAQRINTELSKKFYQIQSAILKLEEAQEFSIDVLKTVLEGKPRQINYSFKSFADKLIDEMLELNQTGNALVYRTAVNRFISFTGNPKLRFEEISYTSLDSFNKLLSAEGVSINAISNYLRTIRAIYNKAIKARVVDRAHYPFYELIIKTQKTVKRALAKDDIIRLEQLNLEPYSKPWHARNYFLLSYYLIGISFTDLAYLKPQNLIKGRIEYRRRKTHKLYSIKLFPKAEAILNHYRGTDGAYLLPILPATVIEDSLESKRVIAQWIKTTNKYLGRLSGLLELTDSLTTYVGRHTWATTAKKLGYSNELIAEALGHEYGNRITNIYLDSFDREVVDEMHYKVIS